MDGAEDGAIDMDGAEEGAVDMDGAREGCKDVDGIVVALKQGRSASGLTSVEIDPVHGLIQTASLPSPRCFIRLLSGTTSPSNAISLSLGTNGIMSSQLTFLIKNRVLVIIFQFKYMLLSFDLML